jgi:hypothetical protein
MIPIPHDENIIAKLVFAGNNLDKATAPKSNNSYDEMRHPMRFSPEHGEHQRARTGQKIA